jgi:uncharacterized protein
VANPFCHVELNTHDVSKAKQFYGQLFDWKLDDMPMPQGTYTMIGVGSGTGGGMAKAPMPDIPSAWMPYVLVDDIHASTAKAKALGASVVVEPMEVPDAGTLSIFIDPTGAKIGLWKPKG